MPALTLFLASASPRRRQLLAAAGIAYEPFVVPVDEEQLAEDYGGPLERLGEYLAICKARAAQQVLRKEGRAGRVLASDTTVLLDGRSLAKPRDTDEAATMLRRLRGREHIVATGVALTDPDTETLHSATSATRVRMRDFGDEEIAAYVATGDPLDKAGAYSIQHPDFQPVATIAGCHLGVIGLPVCIVAALLRKGHLPPQCGRPDADVMPRCCWSGACTSPFPYPDAIHRSVPHSPSIG